MCDVRGFKFLPGVFLLWATLTQQEAAGKCSACFCARRLWFPWCRISYDVRGFKLVPGVFLLWATLIDGLVNGFLPGVDLCSYLSIFHPIYLFSCIYICLSVYILSICLYIYVFVYIWEELRKKYWTGLQKYYIMKSFIKNT